MARHERAARGAPLAARAAIMTYARLAVPLSIITSCLAACSAAGSDGGAAPPGIGKADGAGDVADTGCAIVLDQLTHLSGDDSPAGREAYRATCQELTGRDSCGWAWRGTVDVAAAALSAGASPRILYHADWDGDAWHQVDVLPDPISVTTDHTRFEFAFAYDTSSSLSNVAIEVIPFLETGATRQFDHNRNPGDADNYRLEQASSWSISSDPTVCADRETDAPVRVTCSSRDPSSDLAVDLVDQFDGTYLASVHLTRPASLSAQFSTRLRFTGNAWSFSVDPESLAPFHLVTFGPGRGGNVQVYNDGALVVDLEDIDCRFE
jgi:hypothetical protein